LLISRPLETERLRAELKPIFDSLKN